MSEEQKNMEIKYCVDNTPLLTNFLNILVTQSKHMQEIRKEIKTMHDDQLTMHNDMMIYMTRATNSIDKLLNMLASIDNDESTIDDKNHDNTYNLDIENDLIQLVDDTTNENEEINIPPIIKETDKGIQYALNDAVMGQPLTDNEFDYYNQ